MGKLFLYSSKIFKVVRKEEQGGENWMIFPLTPCTNVISFKFEMYGDVFVGNKNI